jgi:hypothetical protein
MFREKNRFSHNLYQWLFEGHPWKYCWGLLCNGIYSQAVPAVKALNGTLPALAATLEWHKSLVLQCGYTMYLNLKLLWCISINKIQPLVKEGSQMITRLQPVHDKTKY